MDIKDMLHALGGPRKSFFLLSMLFEIDHLGASVVWLLAPGPLFGLIAKRLLMIESVLGNERLCNFQPQLAD